MNEVPLREHIESQMRNDRELRNVLFVAGVVIFALVNAFRETALKIQAIEYERRLNTLNHAHEQALEVQARTVPREIFELSYRETEKKIGDLEKETRGEIRPLQDRRQFDSGRDAKYLATGLAIGGTVASIMAKLIFG